MNKYIVMLASDSHHLIDEPYFYFKGYEVKADSLEAVNLIIDKLQR